MSTGISQGWLPPDDLQVSSARSMRHEQKVTFSETVGCELILRDARVVNRVKSSRVERRDDGQGEVVVPFLLFKRRMQVIQQRANP
jgi:hypothetical protein